MSISYPLLVFQELKSLFISIDKTSLFFKILLIFGFSLLFTFNIVLGFGEQQFVQLAKSFLEGKLYFLDQLPSWYDASIYKGKYFWPLGPLPSFILTPFVYLFGSSTKQGYLQLLFNLLNFFLLYKISFKITKSKTTSLWLSFGYIFATSYLYIALIPFSWYFAQVISTFFILLAIWLALLEKNFLLIGICIALASLTRLNLMLALIFFTFPLLFSNKTPEKKISCIIILYAPVLVSLGILGIYNYLRFQDIFQQGYKFQILYLKPLLSNRDYGLWNIIHFPSNLYYLFLKYPEGSFIPGTKILTIPYIKPDIWGTSIIFTSPLFLWIIQAPLKNPEVRYAIITSILILLTILGYYGIGVRQYGYRYALDLYPFIFLILLYAVRNKSINLLKIVIACSFFINIFMSLLVLYSPID